MFYSDWGSDRRVVHCDLLGYTCKTIRDPSLTSNPNGLSYYDKQVYMVDSNFNHHIEHAHASAYHVWKERWTEQTEQVFLFLFYFDGFVDTFTCPILGPLIPLFLISGEVSSELQSQSGSALFELRRGM